MEHPIDRIIEGFSDGFTIEELAKSLDDENISYQISEQEGEYGSDQEGDYVLIEKVLISREGDYKISQQERRRL